LQTKVRTVKEAENLIFNAMFAIEGVTAASAQLDSLALDLDGYKQIEVGIDKGNQSFAPIYLSLRFCQTASVGDIIEEVKSELKSHEERGLFCWKSKPQTNGQDSSIGAN